MSQGNNTANDTNSSRLLWKKKDPFSTLACLKKKLQNEFQMLRTWDSEVNYDSPLFLGNQSTSHRDHTPLDSNHLQSYSPHLNLPIPNPKTHPAVFILNESQKILISFGVIINASSFSHSAAPHHHHRHSLHSSDSN